MYVKCDVNALEWRVPSWLSGDPVAIEEIRDKDAHPEDKTKDFHTKNQKAFSLPTRLISKIYLFRTIFRGSGWAFANDPNFMGVSNDPAFWDAVNEKFYQKYNRLDRWHKELAECVAQRKPIVSPLGREWLILPNEDGSLPWTVFCNYPVQGTGADLMSVARISLKRRMNDMKLVSLLVSTVHDDIKADCPDEEYLTVGRLMYQVFDNLPKNIKKIFGVELPIQFPCEVVYGPNLLDMKPLTRDMCL